MFDSPPGLSGQQDPYYTHTRMHTHTHSDVYCNYVVCSYANARVIHIKGTAHTGCTVHIICHPVSCAVSPGNTGLTQSIKMQHLDSGASWKTWCFPSVGINRCGLSLMKIHAICLMEALTFTRDSIVGL